MEVCTFNNFWDFSTARVFHSLGLPDLYLDLALELRFLENFRLVFKITYCRYKLLQFYIIYVCDNSVVKYIENFRYLYFKNCLMRIIIDRNDLKTIERRPFLLFFKLYWQKLIPIRNQWKWADWNDLLGIKYFNVFFSGQSFYP